MRLFFCSYWLVTALAPWEVSSGSSSSGWPCAAWGLWCPSPPLPLSTPRRRRPPWKRTPLSADCWGSWTTWWWSFCCSFASLTSTSKLHQTGEDTLRPERPHRESWGARCSFMLLDRKTFEMDFYWISALCLVG